MTKQTEETQCETTQDTSNCTKVSTVYARACIILLALNFCLTGYVLSSLMDIQSVQTEGAQTQTTMVKPQNRVVTMTEEEREEALARLAKETQLNNPTVSPILPPKGQDQ